MPARNVEAYVGEAVECLFGQSHGDFEFIAVDDGSTDATAAILQDWVGRFAAAGRKMILVRRKQGGAGAARNDGLDLAMGDYVCFVDSDDRLRPETLAELADLLDGDDGLDLVFPLCRHIDQDGASLGIVSQADQASYSARDLLFANPIHSGTGVMLRRERAEAAGRFDTTLPACIDLEYWLRVAAPRADNIGVLRKVLVDYRIRPGQITADWRRMRRGWESLLESAERLGLAISGRDRDAALARNALVWSTVAYKHGDFPSARRLAWDVWRHDWRFAMTDTHGRIRSAACIASLLPSRLHDQIRSRFNGSVAQSG